MRICLKGFRIFALLEKLISSDNLISYWIEDRCEYFNVKENVRVFVSFDKRLCLSVIVLQIFNLDIFFIKSFLKLFYVYHVVYEFSNVFRNLLFYSFPHFILLFTHSYYLVSEVPYLKKKTQEFWKKNLFFNVIFQVYTLFLVMLKFDIF